MSRIQGSLARKLALAGLIAAGTISSAFAQTSALSSGLGQSWPNAADVSASPQWHVYVFTLHGIKYVQINDLNGTVHAAIGTAAGTVIVLPVGVDAGNVTTSQVLTNTAATIVYSDGTVSISAMPQSDGSTAFNAATNSQCNISSCGGGRGN
ncbi:hypothetical protein ISP15_09865 [Dyella jejuensis]|uniref:Uncharacterized protein n=1 Tax=Dyella jejuensis TaxID=1432009 RepID=A0ABW8JHR1_9GAMM